MFSSADESPMAEDDDANGSKIKLSSLIWYLFYGTLFSYLNLVWIFMELTGSVIDFLLISKVICVNPPRSYVGLLYNIYYTSS